MEAESGWGSARREPESWWDAARFLVARNVSSLCELSCCAALIFVGTARYTAVSHGMELMVAAFTRCTALDSTPILQMTKFDKQ